MKITKVSIATVLLLVSPLMLLVSNGQDNVEIGLEPIYHELNPSRTKLVPEDKIPEALRELPGWKLLNGRIYKIYETTNFTEAVSLIVKISYAIQKADHHPEIRNIYGKVYVGFTTYDQGKKVTETDVRVAKDVEAAASELGAKKAAGH